MLSPKKVIEIASKWQNAASTKRRSRRRICLSSSTTNGSSPPSSCDGYQRRKFQVSQKGHFVVYSNDNKRFVVPLQYLNHDIFKELLKMSEEEFGLPGSGPIIFPCDGVFVEYVLSLVKQVHTDSEELTFSIRK
ncbi:auxin-responsive protein SAUR64-like [Ricinus communis]|uniref:Calmodulin binding protein, putative n=1 Tax=Ricinus communis TaxID=3988 RepID=B9R8J6_RICCO|nr:auxin-responsive protein SAUR64-like [Ricinus communis]EEF52826.1 calmodulin binding protein, putative [Ricinus communis]